MNDEELIATLRASVAEVKPYATAVTVAAFLWRCIVNAYEDHRGNPEKIQQIVRCSKKVYDEIYGSRDKRKERQRS